MTINDDWLFCIHECVHASICQRLLTVCLCSWSRVLNFTDQLPTGAVLSAMSPPAWNGMNSTVYYVSMDVSAYEMGVRYVALMRKESGYLVKMQGSLVLNFHSLAYLPERNYFVAADRWRIVSLFPGSLSMATLEFEDMPSKGSFKDMVVRGSGRQLLLLSHAARSWLLYTHCAPCPANSQTPAGSTMTGINVCKCNQDYYGKLLKPVLDACTRCRNYGTNLLLNSCPRGSYKTNARCPVDSDRDTTCAVCRY